MKLFHTTSNSSPPPIISLFLRRCPSAICRLIVAIIIDPIKLQSRRTIPHISKEVFESLPTVTHFNASSFVSVGRMIARVLAAIAHTSPYSKFDGITHAVAKIKFLNLLYFYTSTAFNSIPIGKIVGGYRSQLPTITPTKPHDAPLWTLSFWTHSNNHKPPRTFASQILQLHLLSLFLLLFLPCVNAFGQTDTGFFVRADCGTLTPTNNQTLCLQSTTVSGRTAGVVYVYTSGAWTSTSSIGSGDVTDVLGTSSEITSTNSGGPAPTLSIADTFRITGHAVTAPVKTGTSLPATCTTGDLFFKSDATAGSNFYGCTGTNTWTLEGGTTAAASSVTFTPNGTISSVNVQSAVQEVRDEAQPLDADLTAIAALATTGCTARTAANTWANRTLTGTTGNITVTNGDCVAGNPTFDLGATAVQTDQSNTWTTGDQSMAAAASWTMPVATGAAPTANGRCAYDSTANLIKCGFNGTTLTLSTTSVTQPLSAILTSMAGLSGGPPVNAQIPYFTGATTVSLAQFGLCVDSGGQHVNITSVSPLTFSCGTSSTGGISGGTINKYSKYLSATTLGPGISTDDGTNVTIGGGLIVGATPWLIVDTSAIAASDKTWTVLNFSGTVRPSTGVFTPGNIVTTNANGLLIDGGAAGAGTWTDASANTGTNKILVDSLAGGTNTLTLGISASFDGGSLTADGTNCQDPVKVTINSGPAQYAILCATPNSAQFDAVLIDLKHALATIKVRLKANDTVSTQTLAGTFKAQCRATGTAPSSTWGSTQTVSITLTTLNTTYEGLTAAITPNGTCSANSDLYIRYNATGGSNSATTRILGLGIEQQS
jgi:hypothetical protein